jgi:hypothetical protein
MQLSNQPSGHENLRNPSMLGKSVIKLIDNVRLIEGIFLPPISGLIGPCQTPDQQSELKAKRRFVVDTVGDVLRELYLSETRDVKKALDFGFHAKEDLASSGLNELNALCTSLCNRDSASAGEGLTVLYERLKTSFEGQFEEKKFHGKPVVEKTQAGVRGDVEKVGEKGKKSGGVELDATTLKKLGHNQIPLNRDNFDTGSGIHQVGARKVRERR